MKFLTNLNLISVLTIVNQNNTKEIKNLWEINPDVFKILELLGVVKIISSDSELKIELTTLGSSILTNDQLFSSLREQDDKLNSISKDLQRIKSSLSAISFDVIRNQSLDQSNAYDSDLLVPKSQPLKPIPQNSGNQSISINSSNAIFASNFEEFKQYIRSIQENLDSAELQIQKNIIMNIKKSYAKLIDYIQTNNYQEFGFQSFLLIDAIFIFILQIFNQKDPNLLNKSLEKKYNQLNNIT